MCSLSSPGCVDNGCVDTAGSEATGIRAQILPGARGVASSTETFGP